MKKTMLNLLLGVSTTVLMAGQAKSTSEVERTSEVDLTPKYITTTEGIKEYRLNNGMQVLLLPDPSLSNIIVNITYKVGSRHEGYGETGMAHLLEHMLFKSTKKLGDIKKMLSEKGGNANGTTYYDRTNYYEVFPASDESLKWSIEMEADRMVNATILQSDLDKEFSVVRNEFEIGENDPGSILMERIISTGYLWHNYGNSTIGSREDIERVKAERLRPFYEKYYQPDNAVLIIAGKFDEAKALEYVTKYMATIPRPSRPLPKTYTVEPAQDGERFVELKRSGDVAKLMAMYHTAPYADKDFAALDVLLEILQSNPSGHLYKSLIEPQKATNLFGYQPNLRDASYLLLGIDIPKDKNLDETKALFVKELNAISSNSYTEEDLKRGKAKALKGVENIKNNTINYAITLTEVIGAGDYRLMMMYRDQVEKLTVEDLKRVASKYFKTNNRTFGMFTPSGNEERVKSTEITDDQITKMASEFKGKTEEKAEATFESSIDNIKKNMVTQTLNNGFKYVFLKKPVKGKKVMGSFKMPVGTINSLANKTGIADMMASLLKSGNASMTKEQIQDELDQMKANVSFNWSGQSLICNFSTYQEHLTKTMSLIKKCLTESTFSESELAKTKLENKSNLEAQMNEPQSIAFTTLSKKGEKYPKGHIYYTNSPQESIADQATITQAQIVEFYKQFLGSNHGVGTIIGDLNASDVDQLVKNTLDGWNSKASYEKAQPEFFETIASVEKINTPDKENGAAAAGLSVKMNRNNPDYPALVMVNEMLGSGGFLTARIPTRLREKEGISYGAGSFLDIPIDNESGSWGAFAFYNPSFVAKVESALKEEINKAINEGFTAEELKSNIGSWQNGRITSLGNNNFILSLINNSLSTNTSIDEFDNLATKVKALNIDQVNQVIKKYINLDKLILILAGDFNKK